MQALINSQNMEYCVNDVHNSTIFWTWSGSDGFKLQVNVRSVGMEAVIVVMMHIFQATAQPMLTPTKRPLLVVTFFSTYHTSGRKTSYHDIKVFIASSSKWASFSQWYVHTALQVPKINRLKHIYNRLTIYHRRKEVVKGCMATRKVTRRK